MTLMDRRIETLAGRLRSARLFAGLEQKDIADAVGVSRPTVSMWENGKNDIPASKLIAYAELTRVSLNWIAWGTQKAPSEDGAAVRPEGFEPPTYWSVASEPCPYCAERAKLEREYGTTLGPCPLHDGSRDELRWSLDDEHALRLVMDAAVAL